MSGIRQRQRGRLTTAVAAALCMVVALLANLTSAAGSAPPPAATGSPGVPLKLVAGLVRLSTGRAVADLPNGASGPVVLTIGPCMPLGGTSCAGVLSEFSLIGNFKDAAGHPLYSDSDPASVSWTCNAQVCPPPPDVARGGSTLTELQVREYLTHTMYVAPRIPNGTFQPFAPAPACNGVDGAPLPTGTIDPQDTGGAEFCVDVGAIERTNAQCQAVCSSWSGPLTLPVLFVEDPKFMGS